MKEFIAQFTKEKLFDDAYARRIGDDYYLVTPELSQALKKIRLPPLSAGLYLGRQNARTARPGLDLLMMLAKTGAKRVWLNDKGAWLFVCRRPALAASITKCEAGENELVLVLNRHDECIGYGVFDGKNVKNYYDIGDFLRRERTKRF